MAITSDAALNIIKRLNLNVRNGLMSKEEAKKLAVIAVQEIIPAEEANAQDAQDAITEPPKEEPKKEENKPFVGDPKTTILSMLTKLDESIANAWVEFQAGLNNILLGTEGQAFPIGDFDVNANKSKRGTKTAHSSKVNIKVADDKPNTVVVTFDLTRTWDVDGVNPPAKVVSAAQEETCHLGLRKDVVGISEDVMDNSELTWSRSGAPLEAVARVLSIAKKENDTKVVEILESKPAKNDLTTWKNWAISAQAYLLGKDFSEAKKFKEILENVK